MPVHEKITVQSLRQHILKLHVKTTMLISVVILAVLLAVTYIYNARVKALYSQDLRERGVYVAQSLADAINQKGLINNLSDLRYHADSILSRGVIQVRIYG